MAKMIHHVSGPYHYAHHPKLKCDRDACEWPTLDEGPDGKCAWCRLADEKGTEVQMGKLRIPPNWDDMMKTHRVREHQL